LPGFKLHETAESTVEKSRMEHLLLQPVFFSQAPSIAADSNAVKSVTSAIGKLPARAGAKPFAMQRCIHRVLDLGFTF
jgi:hypothetical protein